jgi:hypothetical protein
LQAVTGVGLLDRLHGRLLGPLGPLPFLFCLLAFAGFAGLGRGLADRGQQLLLIQMRVPDVHGAHLGEAGHGLPVGRHRRQRGRPCVGLAEAVVAGRDGEAGRHPLDVVLERPRQGLVEIIHIKQQPPLRRGEGPEVGQMRVPAQLDLEAGGGCAGEVGGHDLGRAPVEGERRDQHPPVPDRHQVGLAGGVLVLEQRDRVGPVAGWRPTVVAGQRRLLARLLAPRPPFLKARMRDLLALGY